MITGASNSRQTNTPYKYSCAFSVGSDCSWTGKKTTLLGYIQHLLRKHNVDVRSVPGFDVLPIRCSAAASPSPPAASPSPPVRRRRNPIPVIPPHMRLPPPPPNYVSGGSIRRSLRLAFRDNT